MARPLVIAQNLGFFLAGILLLRLVRLDPETLSFAVYFFF